MSVDIARAPVSGPPYPPFGGVKCSPLLRIYVPREVGYSIAVASAIYVLCMHMPLPGCCYGGNTPGQKPLILQSKNCSLALALGARVCRPMPLQCVASHTGMHTRPSPAMMCIQHACLLVLAWA